MLHNLMLDVTRKICIKFKTSKSRAAEEICYFCSFALRSLHVNYAFFVFRSVL